jgi:hypothetical protein
MDLTDAARGGGRRRGAVSKNSTRKRAAKRNEK